jgi:large subunit ribosomal protein L21
MYAIIETGGKQYRVEQGDVIDVELLPRTEEAVQFDRVLMVAGDDGIKVGHPVVPGATVSGVLVGDRRAPKVLVFKKKRRKGYKRLRGHRQNLHRVRIESIDI